MLKLITREEIAWTDRQQVVGIPSLARLRAELEAEGWHPVELVLAADGENIDFRLGRGDVALGLDKEQALRSLITIFRASGFEVGFTEVCADEIDGPFVSGSTLVAPLEQVCLYGPVPVEP